MTDSVSPWQILASLTEPRDVEEEREDAAALVMEQMIRLRDAGQLEHVVERYGGHPSSSVTRPLSFLLATAANETPDDAIADLVVRTIRAAGRGDPWTSVNLLTSLHRLAIADNVDDRFPSVFEFVHACLLDDAVVRSAALGLLTRLYEDGVLDQIRNEQADGLRTRLRELIDVDDSDIDIDGLRSYVTDRGSPESDSVDS